MGTSTTELLFQDTSGADSVFKILTSDGTTEILVEDILSDPYSYFKEGQGSYIYDSQTWYSGAMDSP